MDCAAYRDCLSLLMFLSEYLLYAFGTIGAKRPVRRICPCSGRASYDSMQLPAQKEAANAISDHDDSDMLSAAR